MGRARGQVPHEQPPRRLPVGTLAAGPRHGRPFVGASSPRGPGLWRPGAAEPVALAGNRFAQFWAFPAKGRARESRQIRPATQ
eukprot:2323943-Lingulodinium_polyedra.AAC.1